MEILNTIDSPDALKPLDYGQLEALCAEIRGFLIENIAKTGGHLASNLGVVELTVALHRVFDTSKDRLVFDVGHQSYVHKILTGRRGDFPTLRCLGGLSGFPKPDESVHDAAVAGHASSSVSVALGMARGRTLLKEDYAVAALIGDGALTGGLAFEGLSNAGVSGEPMVVVINDNGMSIDANVGGVSSMLSRLRVRPGYFRFKRWYRRVVGKIPPLYNLTHKLKEWLKGRLLPHNIFMDMGFQYLGPVDGHDIKRLEAVLTWAREMGVPVIVHAITQKGKGYSFAENNPEAYHGVGTFDAENGLNEDSHECFSEAFGAALTRLAEKDERISAITASMCAGTGLSVFSGNFPDRFFDAGIAEGHAVSMAAGMAKQGLLPVFAVYSSFLQRGYDMLIHDVALSKLHVVLAVDRAGIVGQDGETHQGSFDVSYLCSVPNMTVLCPSSFAELGAMLSDALYRVKGPVALRYPRGGDGRYSGNAGSAPSVILRGGGDLTLVGYGLMINSILEAAEALEKEGISAEVIKLNLINPLDADSVIVSLKKTGVLLTAEDVCAHGSVGERLLAACAARAVSLRASKTINLGSGVVRQGMPEELFALYGLDAASVAASAKELVERSRGGKS